MEALVIASDHAGIDLKTRLIPWIANQYPERFKVEDLGAHSDVSVDYPDFAHQVAEWIETHRASVGILICGSGIGMSIAANRHPGVRAALCGSAELAKLSRQHNDANVLCLGARFTEARLAETIVAAFLTTPFEAGRHLTRVKKIEQGQGA